MNVKRRVSIVTHVGNIGIGGQNPVRIQSMTNTDTSNIEATVAQTKDLFLAGSELVRVTVNTKEAAKAVPRIKEMLLQEGIEVPLIGDFHYNGHILLREFPSCAQTLDKYRINPGNVGVGKNHDRNFRSIIEIALLHDKSVRIGANWGSLDQALLTRLMDENAKSPEPKNAHAVLLEAMVKSALESALLAESFGMPRAKIILSAKLSSVSDVVQANRMLAASCDYPLHIGLTEAGSGTKGTVISCAALAILLSEGIGDTIRVSLTPAPNQDRTEEVRISQHILQALGIRAFTPSVSSCPGCGRTSNTFFVEMAEVITKYLALQMPHWKSKYPGVENLKVAVMGCVVNGPGESRHADIGISLPGTGENPKVPVYVDGKLFTTLSGPDVTENFIEILENYVKKRYEKTYPP